MKRDEYNKTSGNSNEYDEYSRMYEQQLHKFSAMDGNDYDDTLEYSDLEFHEQNDYKGNVSRERYNPNPHSGNPNGSRTPTYEQRRTQAGGSHNQRSNSNQRNPSAYNSRNRSSQNRKTEDLQFGNNNQKRSSGRTVNAQKDKYSTSTQKNNKNRNSGAKNKMKKKKSPVKRFFKWLIIILLILLVLIETLVYRFVKMVNTVDTGERLVTNASMYDDDIMNVLVIGSDARSLDERGRTDSMILLSVNKKSDEIVMTSFMRDMYVEIPENGWNKMNAANVYGGPELLMDTIEKNFDVRVDKYVYIDFYSFVDIVDAVGGIEIEVSDEEALGMKDPMAEQNKILGNKKGTDYLTEGGKLLLNGNQALAYSRLRYVGNADFERTQRQRTVITKIMEKAVTFNPIKLNNIAKASLSHITTNMTKSELQILANRLPFILKYETKELRIPEEGMYSYGSHNGQSTLDVDFEACRQAIKENIYS